MKIDNLPENNLVVLLLLTILSCGLYLFWWIARISRIFNDNPVTNILLIIFSILAAVCASVFFPFINNAFIIFAGFIWYFYISIKYLQKSEELNGRDMPWFMVLFLPISFLIIQHNINEKYFPGR
ncbi:MAG: hypothetical protein MUC95_02865 [Spirochaetes bacterium]|jgi:hypothetical protein|nr:hypothetical protein [Spirochaetota bacterium]